jgi:hypothetical protein
VNRLVTVPLTQNQFDALVSFTYNLGEGALAESGLLRKLNAGDYAGAAPEFAKWVRAGGVILPGLVRRRAAEADLFVAAEEEESTVADLAHLHPVFRERVIATGVSVLSGARSRARQRQLYDDYLAGTGNPANPPGTSWHEYDETAPWPDVGAADSAATSLVGGCWALAVDFEEPYPHGAPGLTFPIPGEPWHAQPTEVPEKTRTSGAWRRLPLPAPTAPEPVHEEDDMSTAASLNTLYNWGGGVFLLRPFGEPILLTKAENVLALLAAGATAIGDVDDTFHRSAGGTTSTAQFAGNEEATAAVNAAASRTEG